MADDVQSLIDATVALSTAADGLSQTVDKTVPAFEKLFAALAAGGNVLTPAAIAARDAALAMVGKLKTSQDQLDTEVAKTDQTLPNPAPAGRSA